MQTRLIFLLGCFAFAQTACSKRTLPARGELLVLLSSDMQAPDSFNALVVTLGSDPAGTRHVYLTSNDEKKRWLDLSDSTELLDRDCLPQPLDNNAVNLTLPTTLGLQSKSKNGTQTKLSVTACKDGHKLFSTTLDPVTLPGEGEVVLQRLPIRWLCAEKGVAQTLGCYSCESTRCYGQDIHPDASAASPCAVKACQTPQEAYPTVEFDPEETQRYQSQSSPSSGCFNVLGCFATSNLMMPLGQTTVPATVDWRARPENGPATSKLQCIARVQTPNFDLGQLNLALLLPPDTQGTCTETHCLVALEGNSPLGFQMDPKNDGDFILPNAICNMLDSGQVLSVLATDACATHTVDTPVCGTGNQTTTVANTRSYENALRSATVLHYGFEDLEPTQPTAQLFSDDAHGFDQVFVKPAGTTDGAPRIDGVTGLGQTFDSQHYAKSQLRLPYTDDFALNAWVALPETAFAETGGAETRFIYGSRFPVLSSLGDDCTTGFRMDLERCADRYRVQVAFATPSRTEDNGECALSWHYALFAEKSWGGGYFTPFKHGDYRQLTINYTPGMAATFYVDGTLVPSSSTSCAPDTPRGARSDDSYLYLGADRALAQSTEAQTAPIELDELTIFSRALTEMEIRFLYTNTSTARGPGGLYWGAWSTQGGSSNVTASSLKSVTAQVYDQSFSSAGLFALLSRETAPGVLALDEPADLSSYDEAVLWAQIPDNWRDLAGKAPFQFSLLSDHGRRQCTWQLTASSAPYYVINLQQPSWCVDPECGFDFSRIERASVASDWSLADGPSDHFSVSALAFRKRLLTAQDLSPRAPTSVDGQLGPGDWCWRAINYDPQWLTRLSRYHSDQGMSLEVIRGSNKLDKLPELAAHLPPSDDSVGSRDFSQCPSVKVVTGKALPDGKFEFVLTNELGQTWSWPLSRQNGSESYVARLDDKSGQRWPAGLNEASPEFPVPSETKDVRDRAVRMALRFAGALQIKSVQCCNETAEDCVEINDAVPVSTLP